MNPKYLTNRLRHTFSKRRFAISNYGLEGDKDFELGKAIRGLGAEIAPSFAPMGGIQIKAEFPNGWAMSIITGGYGDEENPYEVALLWKDGEMYYDTPATPGGVDVIGWQSASDVFELAKKVAQIPESFDPTGAKAEASPETAPDQPWPSGPLERPSTNE
jgi:hypothetical protein